MRYKVYIYVFAQITITGKYLSMLVADINFFDAYY